MVNIPPRLASYCSCWDASKLENDPPLSAKQLLGDEAPCAAALIPVMTMALKMLLVFLGFPLALVGLVLC